MPQHKCEAVILRRTRFSESSLVVVLLTRELGRVEALARGCRREKSALQGHLDLFNHEEVMIWERRRGGLDLVTDADFIAEFVCPWTSPVAFAAACLIGEILVAGCLVRDPHPRAFDVFTQGLRALDRGAEAGTAALTMLLGVLSDLGFAPRLDACAGCGSALPERETCRLSGVKGGLLCPACAPVSAGWPVSPGETASLRYLAQTSPGNAGRLALTPTEARGMIQTLAGYAEENLGKRLNSKGLLVKLLTRPE